MTMIKVNVADAKTNLSRYLEQVEAGEVVVVCRRNVPIAELRAIAAPARRRRRLGVGRKLFGDWQVPTSFDDPLPDWMLDAFEGRG